MTDNDPNDASETANAAFLVTARVRRDRKKKRRAQELPPLSEANLRLVELGLKAKKT